ncbi:MAG TPA: 5-formyltetrahydrofolate cyclo-ligase [Polyangiaceae bacterium]|jgi:5-formyltetrahydrofolate cyclo-ligase|nr:5-formyltetrahydrofolate cyclo-ligase [Polyangiaceae bacterium]
MPSDHHGFIPSSEEDLLRRRVKAELRKRMRGLRKAFPTSACADRSSRIVERLLAFEPVARARTVALFWPIEERHEVDLRALDALFRERGVRVAYPGLDPETHVMTFRFVDDPDAMQTLGFGFREPGPSDAEAAGDALDAIVVPALAVDPRGHRIGYGAGYYDRTLPRFAPPAVTAAVVFDYQLVAEVPATEGDVTVGWVVTDTRLLRAANPPGGQEPGRPKGTLLRPP